MDHSRALPSVTLTVAIQLILITSCLTALYFSVFEVLVDDWSKNDNYSHGFFIPFVSLYMVYSLRDKLTNIAPTPASWGILVLLAGLLQLYIARVGSEYFLQRTSLLLVLFGIIIFLFGVHYAKKLSIPIGYLIFMVPLPAIIWNKIAFPMQLFSSAITERIVQLAGIPIFRQGNILHLAETTLEVVDACSGLRSLVTMFALSTALAFFCEIATWKKWVLFLSAAPVAILANTVRLTGTAMLASRYGEKVAQGFLHEISGIFTFVVGLLLLMLVNRILHVKE